MANVLAVVSFVVAAATVILSVISAFVAARPAERSIPGKREGSRGQRYLRIFFSIFRVANLVVIFLAVYSFFIDPQSSATQARPYLAFAAIVSSALLVGKFALGAVIVPFLKAIPGAIAGIVVKVGWDKWQTGKPRKPEPHN